MAGIIMGLQLVDFFTMSGASRTTKMLLNGVVRVGYLNIGVLIVNIVWLRLRDMAIVFCALACVVEATEENCTPFDIQSIGV